MARHPRPSLLAAACALAATAAVVFLAAVNAPVSSSPVRTRRRSLLPYGLASLSDPKSVATKPPAAAGTGQPEPCPRDDGGITPAADATAGGCTPEAIRGLARAMASDIERKGRRYRRKSVVLGPLPVLATSPSGEVTAHCFGGLGPALRAFLSHRIAIVGDSTLRYLTGQLGQLVQPILHAERKEEYDAMLSTLEGMTLYEATKIAPRSPHKHLLTPRYAPYDQGDGGALLFHDISVGWTYITEDVRPGLIAFRPTVILANIGLHMLHLWNWGFADNTVQAWLRYEEFLTEAVRVAEEAGAGVLLLKTTNLVCEARYTGEWKSGGQRYAGSVSPGVRAETLGACFDSVRAANPDATAVSDEGIVAYCRDASLTGDGSRKLNERLFRFVDEVNSGGGRPSGLRIAIFDDRVLQSCDTTRRGDGRHHLDQNLARIRLLGNYLDCMQGWGAIATGNVVV